jgi:hypothetical protein
MRGAISPLPQYVFMACCLVKHRDNFTFLPPSTLRPPTWSLSLRFQTKIHYAFIMSPITLWSRFILEMLTVAQLVKKFPAFMEIAGSVPSPQQPATCLYPELSSSPCVLHILHLILMTFGTHLNSFHPSVASSLLDPNIPFRTLCSHTLNLCSSLRV